MKRLWAAENWIRLLGTFRGVALEVDEGWYLSRYPDVRDAIAAGHVSSAASHYRLHGRREGRMPTKPEVDEVWYLLRYPDVCSAIRHGRIESAYEHFIQTGFHEGRLPRHPSAQNRDT